MLFIICLSFFFLCLLLNSIILHHLTKKSHVDLCVCRAWWKQKENKMTENWSDHLDLLKIPITKGILTAKKVNHVKDN